MVYPFLIAPAVFVGFKSIFKSLDRYTTGVFNILGDILIKLVYKD